MENNKQELQTGKLLFNYCSSSQPAPGCAEELHQFEELQKSFNDQFENFFPNTHASKTIVEGVLIYNAHKIKDLKKVKEQ